MDSSKLISWLRKSKTPDDPNRSKAFNFIPKSITMHVGTFSYPMPVNEPVLSYAPGSKEKAALKAALKELKSV